jgi:hypothetical protein
MTSPSPATTHNVEAVVSPATVPRAWTIVPAPRKPMPVMTPAAIRTRLSPVPPLAPMMPMAKLIIMVEPTQTRMLVRKPAGFWLASLSRPMSPPRAIARMSLSRISIRSIGCFLPL